MANHGIASRREAEGWIEQGRVTVNGRVATLGDKALSTDQLCLDEQPIELTSATTEPVIIALNKAVGVICTRHDPQARKKVFDYLPDCPQGRWIMVGRLDINTEGLLLFTNDGELANRLMHPSYQIPREYRVRVRGRVDDAIVVNLLQGVQLEDGPAKFTSMVHRAGKGANHWFDVSLNSGKNRIVRRLFESQDCQVNRLIRTRYGSYRLPEEAAPNEVITLNRHQRYGLLRLVDL